MYWIIPNSTCYNAKRAVYLRKTVRTLRSSRCSSGHKIKNDIACIALCKYMQLHTYLTSHTGVLAHTHTHSHAHTHTQALSHPPAPAVAAGAGVAAAPPSAAAAEASVAGAGVAKASGLTQSPAEDGNIQRDRGR